MRATIADAHRLWPESSSVDDARLTDLLAAAADRCAAYVRPAMWADPTTPGPVPDRVTLAQVLDARDLWATSAAGAAGDVIGFDSYAVRRRPLADSVRGLLDPPERVPKVG